MASNVFRLLVLLLTTIGVGCAHTTKSEWHEVTSARGDYVMEFPGETTTRTQSNPGTGVSIQQTSSEFGGIVFILAETPLNGVASAPLDEAVQGSLEAIRAGTPSSSAAPVTVNEISRTTGKFDGVETRMFACELIDGNKRGLVNSLLFVRNDVVVQATVVSNNEADSESVDRFLSSLKPRSH